MDRWCRLNISKETVGKNTTDQTNLTDTHTAFRPIATGYTLFAMFWWRQNFSLPPNGHIRINPSWHFIYSPTYFYPWENEWPIQMTEAWYFFWQILRGWAVFLEKEWAHVYVSQKKSMRGRAPLLLLSLFALWSLRRAISFLLSIHNAGSFYVNYGDGGGNRHFHFLF